MADGSELMAGETVVSKENETRSSNPKESAEGLKERESEISMKEGKENDVSADSENADEEPRSSSSGRNIAGSSSEGDPEIKTTNGKEDIEESSSKIEISCEESNLNEEELNKDSEEGPEVFPSADDENTNAENDVSVQDIRPSTEENELSVDNVQGAEKESPSKSAEREGMQSLYHIKWTKWKSLNTPIITQNENGPCPLIAIINALILQRKISIPAMQEIISANQLMEYLGDCIFVQAPERLPEGAQLNYEQNMHDAIGIMCKLQTGLDVNVKFTGVTDFEFTSECVVFDLLNIKLMHGWLVDPQNEEAVKAISSLSYNQLVEKIIASKQDGADTELVTEGMVAETFLEQTATQLTYHGLCELNSQIADEELCVFFRNNHFNTLYKQKNELFLLVTDQGFLTEDKVMWETLSNVEGDGCFVDANFKTLAASEPVAPTAPINTVQPIPPTAGISQEDQDYLVALTLQEEQSRAEARERDANELVTNRTAVASGFPTQQSTHPGMTTQEWSDMQLALQLQEEEQRQHVQQQQARTRGDAPRGPVATAERHPRPHVNTNTQPQGTAQQNSNEKCTIL